MVRISDYLLSSLMDEIALARDYYTDDLMENRSDTILLIDDKHCIPVSTSELLNLDKELQAVWEHIVRLRVKLRDTQAAAHGLQG